MQCGTIWYRWNNFINLIGFFPQASTWAGTLNKTACWNAQSFCFFLLSIIKEVGKTTSTEKAISRWQNNLIRKLNDMVHGNSTSAAELPNIIIYSQQPKNRIKKAYNWCRAFLYDVNTNQKSSFCVRERLHG